MLYLIYDPEKMIITIANIEQCLVNKIGGDFSANASFVLPLLLFQPFCYSAPIRLWSDTMKATQKASAGTQLQNVETQLQNIQNMWLNSINRDYNLGDSYYNLEDRFEFNTRDSYQYR